MGSRPGFSGSQHGGARAHVNRTMLLMRWSSQSMALRANAISELPLRINQTSAPTTRADCERFLSQMKGAASANTFAVRER